MRNNANIVGPNVVKFRHRAGWTQDVLAAKMQFDGYILNILMQATTFSIAVFGLSVVLGLCGRIYGISALVLGALFVAYSWGVLYDRQQPNGVSLTKDAPARAAFKYSILYLLILFGACAVDRLV